MDTHDQPILGRRTFFGTYGIATCPRNGTLPETVSSSYGNEGIPPRSRNTGYALPHPHYAQRSSLSRLLPSVQPPKRPKVNMMELLTPLGELLNATCGRYLQGERWTPLASPTLYRPDRKRRRGPIAAPLCIQAEEACPNRPIDLYFGRRESLDPEVAGARPGSTQKATIGGFTLGGVIVHAW